MLGAGAALTIGGLTVGKIIKILAGGTAAGELLKRLKEQANRLASTHAQIKASHECQTIDNLITECVSSFEELNKIKNVMFSCHEGLPTAIEKGRIFVESHAIQKQDKGKEKEEKIEKIEKYGDLKKALEAHLKWLEEAFGDSQKIKAFLSFANSGDDEKILDMLSTIKDSHKLLLTAEVLVNSENPKIPDKNKEEPNKANGSPKKDNGTIKTDTTISTAPVKEIKILYEVLGGTLSSLQEQRICQKVQEQLESFSKGNSPSRLLHQDIKDVIECHIPKYSECERSFSGAYYRFKYGMKSKTIEERRKFLLTLMWAYVHSLKSDRVNILYEALYALRKDYRNSFELKRLTKQLMLEITEVLIKLEETGKESLRYSSIAAERQQVETLKNNFDEAKKEAEVAKKEAEVAKKEAEVAKKEAEVAKDEKTEMAELVGKLINGSIGNDEKERLNVLQMKALNKSNTSSKKNESKSEPDSTPSTSSNSTQLSSAEILQNLNDYYPKKNVTLQELTGAENNLFVALALSLNNVRRTTRYTEKSLRLTWSRYKIEHPNNVTRLRNRVIEKEMAVEKPVHAKTSERIKYFFIDHPETKRLKKDIKRVQKEAQENGDFIEYTLEEIKDLKLDEEVTLARMRIAVEGSILCRSLPLDFFQLVTVRDDAGSSDIDAQYHSIGKDFCHKINKEDRQPINQYPTLLYLKDTGRYMPLLFKWPIPKRNDAGGLEACNSKPSFFSKSLI